MSRIFASLGRRFPVLVRIRELFPLTPLGLTVAAAAAATYFWFAKPHADYALGLASRLAIGLVLLSLLAVVLGALLIYGRLRRLPESGPAVIFEAARGYARGLCLPRWRSLPLLEVSWTWAEPEGFEVSLIREGGEVIEEVTSPTRARFERVVRRFVIEDGFGLAQVVLRHVERRPLRVSPFVGRLDQAPVLQSLTAGDDLPHPRGRPDGDRVDMRRYVAGDPLRLALWKIYARTGQLMVRMPERALAPSVRVVAYLVAGPGDEAAAAASRWAVERGLLGDDWRFGADGGLGVAADADAALELIMASRAVREDPARQGAGLAAFLEQVLERDEARVVVFVPGQPGPWLDRVTAALAGRARNATCVVGVDGLRAEAEPTTRDRLTHLLTRPEPPDPEEEAVVSPDALRAVTTALVRTGAQALVLDRRAGRALPVGGSGRLEQAYADALAHGGHAA
ncbi:MAG: DUF58 domain-containing protein [Myxococcales bacterium]|nr:DUF58 domain-containing protein [Myxococcales bacterium]